MPLSSYLLYLTAGRLLVWLLQINGLTKPIWDSHPKLQELGECDLCLGFWVYLFLALFVKGATLGLWSWPIDRLVLAAVSAMGAHLLRIGWDSKFGITVV